MCQPEKNNKIGGFALIDAVLATAVFAIGLLALNALYHTVIKNDHNAFVMTDAVELAGSYIDQLLSEPYGSNSTVSSIHGLKTYSVNTILSPCPSGSSCIENTTNVTVIITKPDGTSYSFSTVKARLKGLP